VPGASLKHRERSIGPFLIPFVVIFSVAGVLIPFRPTPPRPETSGALFALHVTLAILGYAAFRALLRSLALYLVQSRQIRRAQTGVLFARLPALEAIGGMNRTAVSIGLVSLLVSTLLGAAWAERVWNSLGDAKLAWAIFTLAVYGSCCGWTGGDGRGNGWRSSRSSASASSSFPTRS
jgi:ABC-type uncharacterized transport system permease subunit